jgi:hypothetical protein
MIDSDSSAFVTDYNGKSGLNDLARLLKEESNQIVAFVKWGLVDDQGDLLVNKLKWLKKM